MKTYYLYIIQAYEHYDVGTGGLRDVSFIKLIGDTAFEQEEMLKKATRMIKKTGYRIAEIAEYPVNNQGDHHGSHTG